VEVVRVELFKSSDMVELERDINEFLTNHNIISILDIKYQFERQQCSEYHTGMIIYRTSPNEEA